VCGLGLGEDHEQEKEAVSTVSSRKVVTFMSYAREIEAFNCMDESVIAQAAGVPMFGRHEELSGSRGLYSSTSIQDHISKFIKS
jgi:hypothetical protein